MIIVRWCSLHLEIQGPTYIRQKHNYQILCVLQHLSNHICSCLYVDQCLLVSSPSSILTWLLCNSDLTEINYDPFPGILRAHWCRGSVSLILLWFSWIKTVFWICEQQYDTPQQKDEVNHPKHLSPRPTRSPALPAAPQWTLHEGIGSGVSDRLQYVIQLCYVQV